MSHKGYRNLTKKSAKRHQNRSQKCQQNRSTPRVQAAFGSNNFHSKSNQIKSNQIYFSNSNFTKLINYVKLQRDFIQKGKKRTFQMLHNRKFQNLMSRSRAYNQIALAKLSGDALLG